MKQTTRFDLGVLIKFFVPSLFFIGMIVSSFSFSGKNSQYMLDFFMLLFVCRMRASSLTSSFSSAWPDPKSPVLSKIDFGVPVIELFKWLEIRDTFLGDNYKKQDITAALALARDCKHSDAVWLTSIFEGKDVSTKEDARVVFLSHQNDARALCFAWCLMGERDRQIDLTLLSRASEMGNAFACSMLSREVWGGNEEEAFRLARLAASQHERDGFYLLARCFRNGLGCEQDLNLAKQNLLIAAELGGVFAAYDCGEWLDDSDPARWFWLGRAALRCFPGLFLRSFPKQVKQFFSSSGNASVVFLIGRALKGNIDVEKKQFFGIDYSFDSYIGAANQAVSFYESQIKSARLAVDTWTLVATRLRVIKDMRIYVSKLIWEARFEANYGI